MTKQEKIISIIENKINKERENVKERYEKIKNTDTLFALEIYRKQFDYFSHRLGVLEEILEEVKNID